MTRKKAIDILRYEVDKMADSRGTDYSGVIAMGVAIHSMKKLNAIADLLDGSIDHFDYDTAMDMLYEIKELI